MRKEFACTPLFLSVLSISPMHAASGLCPWTMELSGFASHQLAPDTVDLSVYFIRSHFVQFFLLSEAGGGSRPRSEALCCTYSYIEFGSVR